MAGSHLMPPQQHMCNGLARLADDRCWHGTVIGTTGHGLRSADHNKQCLLTELSYR